MGITVTLLLGLASVILYCICSWCTRKRRKSGPDEPPSVGRYPLVGSYFHLQEPLYLSLHERFNHEPIVRVYFGTQRVYVFNRWASFKTAMVDNAEQLSGRLSQKLATKILKETGGLMPSEGDVWRQYRRFTLRTLRDLGLGRREVQEIILSEAEHLRRSLDETVGRPTEISASILTATSNVVCQLVFGSRLALEDPEFDKILELIQTIGQNSSSTLSCYFLLTLIPITDAMPWIVDLLLKLPKTKVVVDDFLRLQTYCRAQIEKRKVDVGRADRATDYIEAHLLHQNSQSEIFNDTRLSMAVSDLFIAGTDTTANTLRWAILFMIANPDVADKVHQEILTHIGSERLPTMQDKANLHYTQAVIEEVHRRASLIPLGVFHRVTADITVGGVTLKENSICLFNVYSIHHDAELFPEPKLFKPERHLGAEGQFVPCPHLASFGLGKRACLGESLARMELLILFVTLMQRYRFSLDPEDSRTLWDLMEDPSFSKGTIMRSPPVHNTILTLR